MEEGLGVVPVIGAARLGWVGGKVGGGESIGDD